MPAATTPQQALHQSHCRGGGNKARPSAGCRCYAGYNVRPMMPFQNLIIFLIALYSIPVTAQNPNRHYLGHVQSGNRIAISVNDGTYNLTFYNDRIIETAFTPGSGPSTIPSHAVAMTPANTVVTASETNTGVVFTSAGISVSIGKSPFHIQYAYRNRPLLSEKSGYTQTVGGYIIDFNLTTSEALYGGGARVLGMNRRGNRLQLYNRAHYGYETRSELMNYTMPLAVSSNRYMVHFDNPATGWLDFDSSRNNTLAYESSGRKTYQVIAADSWPELIEAYTELTGRQPMPPRWALGNFASRFGYHSQAETESTVEKFRREKIPVDAVILDLYWFGKDIKGTMGNLDVFRDSFPHFEKMVSRFNRKGIRTIPITEPFILTTSKRWQEAVDAGILATGPSGKPHTYDFYFGNTGLIDVFNPRAQSWFWNIYKTLADKGVAGVWGDLGEPEVHPTELRHTAGTADEVHNIYGHQWAKLIFEGYRRDFPATRPFILMRSGYSGSQRYGMIPWSGDVNRTWGGLSGQPEIALQMGLQGLSYMHSDLGGFAGANLDDELYARWLQYGVFQPVFRPHAQEEVPSEPVFRSASAKEKARKAINLRYQLLPYNYTLAFQNSISGLPLMRPVFFEEPDNPGALSDASRYFWGDHFFVSPVLTAGAVKQKMAFPKTGNWFDFYSDAVFAGGQTVDVPLSPDHIPTFVRGGAIIPMIPVVQKTDDYDKADLSLHYYFDPQAGPVTSELYEDDGTTPDALQKGRYIRYRFTTSPSNGTVLVQIAPEKGVHFPRRKKRATFVMHHTSEPKAVWLNNRKLRFRYDGITKTMTFPVKLDGTPSDIKIQL